VRRRRQLDTGVEDPEAGDRAQKTSKPGGAQMAQVHRGGRARGRRGHRWRTLRSPVEDESGRRGWRELGSGTTTGTPAASRPKAGLGMAMSTKSGLGTAMEAASRPRPAVTSREAIAIAQHRGRQRCRWHVQAALGFCVRVVTPFIPGILLVSADIAQSKPISDLWYQLT
jgi:hypothetical protein